MVAVMGCEAWCKFELSFFDDREVAVLSFVVDWVMTFANDQFVAKVVDEPIFAPVGASIKNWICVGASQIHDCGRSGFAFVVDEDFVGCDFFVFGAVCLGSSLIVIEYNFFFVWRNINYGVAVVNHLFDVGCDKASARVGRVGI